MYIFTNMYFECWYTISNSNWTEWSTIQRVIGRVILKLDEREAQSRFEITSPITPWIVRHEVQLQINRNYSKIREEYDSVKLFERLIYSTSKLDAEKEPIQVQLARAWWCVLSNYSGMMRTTVQLQAHDVCNCTITAQIGAAEDQSDSILIYSSYDYNYY